MTKQTPIEPQAGQIPRFLIWTFAISWGCWGLGLVLMQVWPSSPLAILLINAGSFGPAVAACRVLQRSWRNLPRFLFSAKKGSWLPLLILAGLSLVSSLLTSQGWDSAISIGVFLFTFVGTLFLGGGNEEPGWRGFLQPALEKQYSFPIATVLVGVVWSVWHLPLWLIPGSGQAGTSFLVFLLSTIAISFAFAGLYKRTRSVWVCMLLHTWLNVMDVGFIGGGEQLLIRIAGPVIMAAYGICLWYQTGRQEKKAPLQ